MKMAAVVYSTYVTKLPKEASRHLLTLWLSSKQEFQVFHRFTTVVADDSLRFQVESFRYCRLDPGKMYLNILFPGLFLGCWLALGVQSLKFQTSGSASASTRGRQGVCPGTMVSIQVRVLPSSRGAGLVYMTKRHELH